MPSTRRRAASRSPGPRLRRGLTLAAATALVLGVAYVAARQTSIFALRTIDVRGADPVVAAQVRNALASFEGRSLVSLDPQELERVAGRVPYVESASADRSFPRSVVIRIVEERPVAVVRQAERGWLVAASSRVLAPLSLGELESMPRIWLADETEPLTVGATLTEQQGADAVRALAQVPPGFPTRVLAAHGTVDAMTFVLTGKTELRLGELSDLDQKLSAAAGVLKALGTTAASELAYLDVSLPTRPVGFEKSQVESRA